MGIEKVEALVSRFKEQEARYVRPGYSEANVQREFIEPFFEALGWDIYNKAGFAEAYKAVMHQPRLLTHTQNLAPDYAFRIGGTLKFYVEAKSPVEDLDNDAGPARQLRRYGWSARLPVSVLTNFREFAVFDCKIKPSISDGPRTCLIRYLRFDQYIEQWDWIRGTFSPEAIGRGAFDKFAEATDAHQGTMRVDEDFLALIETWRGSLASHLHRQHPDLEVFDLNLAVQKIIDRIVFMRIAEDRGFEPQKQLAKLLDGKNVYQRLVDLWRTADRRYNSGIFHLIKDERPTNTIDNLTPSLKVNDFCLQEIIEGIYYPQSQYEFSAMPLDILGQIYERYLGKTLVPERGNLIVKTKPELRKSGGVYYTPTYVVRFIVENTLGKFLPGKTIPKIRNLSIVDPACGSGSFLIEAYRLLLDWYLDQYVRAGASQYSQGKDPKIFGSEQTGWKLTIEEKKRILLRHIYGVDLDPQAVEIAKLSLCLKLLEGESEDSIASQQKLFHQRALPDLDDNIKCGNSLVSLHRGYDRLQFWQSFRGDAESDASSGAGRSASETLAFESKHHLMN